MSLFTHPTPAFAGRLRASVQPSLDQLERAVTNTLAELEPGHRNAAEAVDAAARRQLRSGTVIDEALKNTTQAHIEALGQAGLPAPVLELLQSWVEATVDARVLQRQIALKRAIDHARGEIALQASPALSADPTEPLSANALGQALGGLSDETVRQRERAGELFSILRPGRKRGREYPAFQAWPGIAGEPLAKVLAALGPVSSTVAYGFCTSATDLLGGLTPIEATLGRLTSPRDLEPETQALLAAAPQERLAAVVKAAQAYAALQAA
jgi:hypothetical protein